ncbi:single-stranded DNA-binding protein [Prevotella aurantiaca]|uniref:single-stranded DNA-binding protein n=1 Tax=Prevotella aurantiaca TaxID=596085 RepID=UPI0028EE9141|nr:single-stranded DNA-binding protein [Prevotella aurantiaca]
MKKDYNAPQISVMSIEVEQRFLTLSVTGNTHEGFVEVADPNLKIEDATGDDSPF